MSLSESAEMYLETIYIIQKDHGHAHVVDVANKMGVSKPSVTKAMNQLKEEGLVSKEAYGHITLTKLGEELSVEVVKKHQTISRFLELSLKLKPEVASQNACKMEHVICDKMMCAIEAYLEDICPSAKKSS